MAKQQYRYPLAGPYNTRVVSVLPAVSGVVGSGIVGIMIVGKTATTSNKDRRFINCWPETVPNKVNGTNTIYLVKRPGFAALNTPQSGSIGNAIMVWSGQGSGTKVISAFGATNSSIYDGTTQLVTNNGDTTVITGRATGITETSISNTPTLAITSSDNTAWYYQDAGTVTKITDSDFPGNASKTLAGTFAHMDGYAFVMDTTGNIWNSDINTLTAWSASSSIPCNSYPDVGVGCIRRGSFIIGFGTQSIQFFRNVGNASGSVLQRVEEMTIKIGCIGANAIATVGDNVYWTGSTPEGGLSVYRLSDGIKSVSTPEINRTLQIAGADNVTVTAAKIYGRSFVIVKASTLSFIYCEEEDSWSELSSNQGILWTKCSGVSTGTSQVTYSISNTLTSGKVYVIDPSNYVYTDDSVTFTATAQSALMGDGRIRSFYYDMALLADQEQTSSPVSVFVSDDDYDTATLIGTVDLSDARPRLNRCGAAYRRSWIFQHSANTPFRIEAMVGTVETGEV